MNEALVPVSTLVRPESRPDRIEFSIKDVCAFTGWVARHARRVAREKWGVRPHRKVPITAMPIELQRKASAWLAKNKPRVTIVEPTPALSSPERLAATQLEERLPFITDVAQTETRANNDLADSRYQMIVGLVHPDSADGQAIWKKSNCQNVSELVLYLAAHAPDKVSTRTIWRWVDKYRAGGLLALGDKVRKDKGKGRGDQLGHGFNAAAEDYMRGCLAPDGAATLKLSEMHRNYCDERKIRERFPQRGQALPELSYNAYVFWWNRIWRSMRTLARDGERAFKVNEGLIILRHRPKLPNDWWIADHRKRDFFCMEPDPDANDGEGGWRLYRPFSTCLLDWCTWTWPGFVTVKTPSSDSIAAALLRGVLNHGVPFNMLSDNGSDYASEYISGGMSFRSPKLTAMPLDKRRVGVYQSLGINISFALPENSRGKPIESAFNRLAAADRQMPVWCGHNADARNERFDHLWKLHLKWAKGEPIHKPEWEGKPWPFMAVFPTIEEVAELDEFIFPQLNRQSFSPGTPGMRKLLPDGGSGWMSPQELWEKLIGHAPVRRPDPQTLQAAFLHRWEDRGDKREGITVGNGMVKKQIHGNQYAYRNEECPQLLASLNGQRVDVGYDPFDYDTVAIYHDGQFICLAHDIERRQMGRDDYKVDMREAQALLSQQKRWLRAQTPNPGLIDYSRDRQAIQVRPALAAREPNPRMPTLTEAYASSVCDPAPVHTIDAHRATDAAGSQTDDGEFNFWGSDE